MPGSGIGTQLPILNSVPYIGNVGAIGALIDALINSKNLIDQVGLPDFNGSPSRSNSGIPGIGDMNTDQLTDYFNSIGYQVPGMLQDRNNRGIQYETSGPDVLSGLRPDGTYGPANPNYGMSSDELNNILLQSGSTTDPVTYTNPYGYQATIPGFNPNPAPNYGPQEQTFMGSDIGFNKTNSYQDQDLSQLFNQISQQNQLFKQQEVGYNQPMFSSFGQSVPNQSSVQGPTQSSFMNQNTIPTPASNPSTPISYNPMPFITSSTNLPSSLGTSSFSTGSDLNDTLMRQQLENRKQSFNQKFPSIV